MSTKSVHLLVSVNYTGCEDTDEEKVVFNDVLEEIKIEAVIKDALKQKDYTFAITEGASLDPTVVPEDYIQCFSREDVIQAISDLRNYKESCSKEVVKLNDPLLPALRIALPILEKCLHLQSPHPLQNTNVGDSL